VQVVSLEDGVGLGMAVAGDGADLGNRAVRQRQPGDRGTAQVGDIPARKPVTPRAVTLTHDARADPSAAEKGATFKATEQPIDTGTAAGKCFLDMLGVFAEFETNLRPCRDTVS
jgi:hypothetical protein